MAKFRKKPIVVEAWPASDLHRAAGHDWHALPGAIVRAYEEGDVLFLNIPSRIEIVTPEGVMAANLEDMVIQGVNGELYPCKPDIFEATYEAVED